MQYAILKNCRRGEATPQSVLSLWLCCKAQKMEVIGHQDIGVDGAIMHRRRFGEPGLQPAVVVLAKKIGWWLLPRWITCSGRWGRK